MNILLTGSSGFIGSRVAAALAAVGHRVVATGRSRPLSVKASDFLAADFSAIPSPQWWASQLGGIDVVINAVGVFQSAGSQRFEALHTHAPIALFEGCVTAGVRLVIQISALGSDQHAQTAYHRSKAAADHSLQRMPIRSVIVQPSLVYSPQGVSAGFFNQLAVLPVLVLPDTASHIQPVHIEDVVEGIVQLVQDESRSHHPQQNETRSSRTLAFVGPQPLTLLAYLAALRQSLGKSRKAWVMKIPSRWFLDLASLAGKFPGSLVNRDSVSMLLRGNAADPEEFTRLLGRLPKPASHFIPADMASLTLADAVLRWVLPLMNAAIGLVWIWTGIVSLGLYPVAGSYELLADFGLAGVLATFALYSGAVLDLALGILTFTTRGRPRQLVLLMQFLVIATYTFLITLRIPEWWLHPFGPLSKNLPMLAGIALLLAMEPRPRGR